MHSITPQRKTAREVPPVILGCQIDELIRKAFVGARGRWHCVKHPIEEIGESGDHTYKIKLEFHRQRAAPDDPVVNSEFLNIKNRLIRTGASTIHGDNPWEIVEPGPNPLLILVEPNKTYSRYRIKVGNQPLDDYDYDHTTARTIASALTKFQRMIANA